jgi:hypothetical protein
MENTYNFIIDRLYQDSLNKYNKNKCIKLLHAIKNYNKKISIVKDDTINKIKIENLTLQNKILDLEKEKNDLIIEKENLNKIKIENITLLNKILDLEKEKNDLITKAENDYDFLLNYDIEVHKKINNEKDKLKIKIAILEYQILNFNQMANQMANQQDNQHDNPSKKRKFEN